MAKKAVIFDIDGTLTRDISWVRMTVGVGGLITYNDKVMKDWQTGLITEAEAYKKCIDNWSKNGRVSYDKITSILKKIPLREDAKETIDYLKSKGYLVCAITGSFDVYATMVCQELGIPDWFAITSLFWDEKKKLINMSMVTNEKAGDRKMEFLKKYCIKNNLKLNECVPVGDSENDMALFKFTGNGVAVRTQFEAKELESIAWKKINHLSELKNIL